jgi:hypothetical protein
MQAKRGSRDIRLLFLNFGARYSHSFNGLTPGKQHRYPPTRRIGENRTSLAPTAVRTLARSSRSEALSRPPLSSWEHKNIALGRGTEISLNVLLGSNFEPKRIIRKVGVDLVGLCVLGGQSSYTQGCIGYQR